MECERASLDSLTEGAFMRVGNPYDFAARQTFSLPFRRPVPRVQQIRAASPPVVAPRMLGLARTSEPRPILPEGTGPQVVRTGQASILVKTVSLGKF